MQAAPVPEDVLDSHEQRRSEMAAYKAGLSLDELPLIEVKDDRLSRLLAQLGRSVQQRESARRSEP